MTSTAEQFRQTAARFTVVLIAGYPRPSVGGESDDRPRDGETRAGHFDPADLTAQHWLWESSVRSLLNTVFARGGTVVTTLEEEFITTVWGIAQKYAPPVAAEHGESPADPIVYAMTDSQDAFDDAIRRRPEGGDGRNRESWFTSLAGTGLVQARLLEGELGVLPGPGPHFGISLNPVASTELERRLLSEAEQITVVRWPGQESDRNPRGNTSEIEMEGDAPPLHYHLESLVDSWADQGRGPEF